MLNIKLIRENTTLVRENIEKKFRSDKSKILDEVIRLDLEWRKLKSKSDQLRRDRNKISIKISELKKQKKNPADLLKQAKIIPQKILSVEEKSTKIKKTINDLLSQLPNIISEKTPIGKDESQNKEIKKVGKPKKYSFALKNHVELLEKLDLADFDSSAKVSGNGFYYLKGDLALLNQALIRFTIDFMNKKGYHYIETPLMLNEKSIFASMDKEAIEDSVYSIENEDLNLIGTAEQSLLAMHYGTTFSESELPRKYFSYSMCFRKEIGSHGINEKGLWRTHQFNKVEQFVFCHPVESEMLYDEMLKNSEQILKALKIPFRVIEICSGDLSDWKFRSHDLEVWRPTIHAYGEIGSLSNCTDYQARKLNIKYTDRKKGDRVVLHTLNNTALATSRALVAILENYQQKDGSVKIPTVLQKYMDGKSIIGKPKKSR